MRKLYLVLFALFFSLISFAQVGPITGTFSVCVGSTTTLNCTPPGGTWSSSNPAIASIGLSTGVVTGNAAGVVTITYGLSSGFAIASFTVNPLPAPITCPSSGCIVCEGSTITVTDATPGGTWTSNNPTIATIGSSSGIVTGVAAGTTTLTYMLPTGCYMTTPITVNPAPLTFTMTGGGSYCSGGPGVLVGLSGSQVGVTYQLMCGVTPVGSPVAGTGAAISFGLQTGPCTYTVIASNTFGCRVTLGSVTVTPLPAPAPIICPTTGCNVCTGNTVTLTDAVTGGTWSSSNTGIATVGSSTGIVTGITPGVVTITYTLGNGCFVTTTLTVNASPTAITGTLTVCVGSTTTLNSTPSGGIWSSSGTNATIGSVSGVVTGVNAGTEVVTYTLATGCFVTAVVTVDPTPVAGTSVGLAPIVCVGSTIALFGSPTGGVWSSANTTIATVGSSSGVVTGISPGVVNIIYTLPTGCFTTVSVTVNQAPTAITGTMSVCVGSTTTLFSTPPGGIWSSSGTNATVGSSSGIVTGVAAGTEVITYTLANGCYVTAVVTVNTTPTILGITTGAHVCTGSTLTLIGSPTGGVWTSGNTTIATVGSSSGVVTGVTPGVTTITYTLLPSGCFVSISLTVDPTPTPITGITVICTGNTTTLSSTPPGGTWTSSNITVATVGPTSGVVTGVSAGIVTITYMLATGCFTTTSVTVNTTPTIVGSSGTLPLSTMCVGATQTLTGIPAGGTWTSSNSGVATIGSSSGVVTAIAPGVTMITYMLATGCFTTMTITVNPNPAAITGTMTVCVGSTTTLNCTPGGGTWTSSGVNATVGLSSGIVTGVNAGTEVITYMLPTGCYSTAVVTVNPLPASIGGPTTVCIGSTITLTSSPSGGTWSSSNPLVATVGSTGIVTGVSAGTVTIVYTLPTGCSKSIIINVVPMPLPIVGPSTGNQMCIGGSITLTDPTTGGIWSSANPGVATVGSTSGVVTGVGVGITTITYSMGGSCFVTTFVTVNPNPATITGPNTVCVGNTITLSCITPGGTWSTACGNATVAGSTGVVTGMSAGPCTITYTLPTGCFAVKTITVNPLPCTNGVAEIAAEAVEVFPNPAFEAVTIKTMANTFSSFTITNSMGQLMKEQRISRTETVVSVKDMAPGVYFISLRGENGITVRRFVKE